MTKATEYETESKLLSNREKNMDNSSKMLATMTPDEKISEIEK